jgi:ferrochelatase
VFPLYPQYASSSTGSSHQKVLELVSKWDQIPNISLINSYYNHPLFIESLIDAGKKYDVNEYDHVVFSYHGLPERHLRNGDVTKTHCLASKDCCATINHKNQFCYRAQCYNTTQLLAEKLNLPKEKWTFAFQSRLGKEPWLQPYTWDTLATLAKEGKKKVLVFSPAFVADCLETIFEIKEEYFELFKEKGGEVLQLVESLNDNEKWVECVTTIIKENE